VPKSQETPWFPYIGGAAVAGLAVGALLAFLKKRRENQAH
jgi:LPXTG-motif cell wall-anchored protein